MAGKTRGRKFAPEREALLAKLIEDEWPLRQICKTHGFNFYTVKRLYPDYEGMSQVEGGKLSYAIKAADLKINKTYALGPSEKFSLTR
jgi:hypothetical protein